jgi:hypothetical protein
VTEYEIYAIKVLAEVTRRVGEWWDRDLPCRRACAEIIRAELEAENRDFTGDLDQDVGYIISVINRSPREKTPLRANKRKRQLVPQWTAT